MDENIILSAKGLDLWYGPTQALEAVRPFYIPRPGLW